MIPSPPPKRPQLGFVYVPPFRVQGISIAGEQTVVQVPELDVCFDIGSCPKAVLASPYVALSHGHMDHAASMAYYFSQREFQGMGTGTLICPPELAPALDALMQAWVNVEGQRTPYRLLPLKPDDEHEVKPKTFIRPFRTPHTAASQGYVVVEKRTKLKPELAGLTQQQIVELKQRGEEVTNRFEVPLVAFTGDTMWGPWAQRPDVLAAKVLIAECTFLEPGHRKRATVGRHLHLDHILELLETSTAEALVLIHLSRRTSMQESRQFIDRAIPPQHAHRVHVLMDARANRARYEQQLAQAEPA